jgi:hypothetical protein
VEVDIGRTRYCNRWSIHFGCCLFDSHVCVERMLKLVVDFFSQLELARDFHVLLLQHLIVILCHTTLRLLPIGVSFSINKLPHIGFF